MIFRPTAWVHVIFTSIESTIFVSKQVLISAINTTPECTVYDKQTLTQST